jgi:hypothetical protein
MKHYEFTLRFTIADAGMDTDALIEKLYEAGCDDALIGSGQPGRLALQFTREASSAEQAMQSAIQNVQSAAPLAMLAEAGPDYAGLSDIADLLGCSRQNMRKLMLSHASHTPVPVHEGSTAIWHLADVLVWLRETKQRDVDPLLLEVAIFSKRLNMARHIKLPFSEADLLVGLDAQNVHADALASR